MSKNYGSSDVDVSFLTKTIIIQLAKLFKLIITEYIFQSKVKDIYSWYLVLITFGNSNEDLLNSKNPAKIFSIPQVKALC